MKKLLLISALLTVFSISAFAEQIPVIKIKTKSGSTDFASKPVAKLVTESRASWGDVRDDPAPFAEACGVSVFDENGTLKITNLGAKVKVRGNWTTSYDKKSMKITFDRKQNVLDLNHGRKNKDWVLLAVYKDWSYMRDYTALKFARSISKGYASDAKLVELYIDDQYWGVYLLAELQEVCADRFNITEPRKKYKGVDTGYLLEYDGYAYAEKEKKSFYIDYTGPVRDINNTKVNCSTTGYSIKSEINDRAQRDFIANYMNKLWKICYDAVYKNTFWEFDDSLTELVQATDANNVYDVVSKVIDIDSLVDAYIIAEVTCDPDLYYTSFYMDVDFGEKGDGKLRFEGPWDFDSSMGNKDFCADGKGIFAGQIAWDVNHNEKVHGNPWMMIFVNCDWFQDAVKTKWKRISYAKYVDDLILNIDKTTALYEKNFKADKKRWNHLGKNELVGNELCPASASCTTQKAAAKRLKTWLTARFAYLDSIWGS